MRFRMPFLLAGVLVFSIVLLVEQEMRPGYSAWEDPISVLGAGNDLSALLFNGALAFLGFTTFLFALGLPRGLAPQRVSVLALGVDLVLAAVFPVETSVHWVFGLLLYVLPAIAIWSFLAYFLRHQERTLAALTLATILPASMGLWLTLVGGGAILGAGAVERMIDYPGLAWGAAISGGSLLSPARGWSNYFWTRPQLRGSTARH